MFDECCKVCLRKVSGYVLGVLGECIWEDIWEGIWEAILGDASILGGYTWGWLYVGMGCASSIQMCLVKDGTERL